MSLQKPVGTCLLFLLAKCGGSEYKVLIFQPSAEQVS